MSEVAVTRVINPCALIEVGDVAVLADPYFSGHRFLPMVEPIGLMPGDLPPLRAVLGGHGVFDHWQPKSMAAYRHHATTTVLVGEARMARSARRAGFDDVHVMAWGDEHALSADVTVTCLPGESVLAFRTSAFLLRTAEVSVYVSTEARSLDAIRVCADRHHVDVAVLPIDGLSLRRKQLVMTAADAIEATKLLGADTLFPIHYSQRAIPGILRSPSGIDDLLARAGDVGFDIRHGATGERVTRRPTRSSV